LGAAVGISFEGIQDFTVKRFSTPHLVLAAALIAIASGCASTSQSKATLSVEQIATFLSL
jgi:type IV pilus biogenesis protein CpaD/CtpE